MTKLVHLGAAGTPARPPAHGIFGSGRVNVSVATAASPLASPASRAATPVKRLVFSRSRGGTPVALCPTGSTLTPLSAQIRGGSAHVSIGLTAGSRHSPPTASRAVSPPPLPSIGIPPTQAHAIVGHCRTSCAVGATPRARSASPVAQTRWMAFQKSAITSPPIGFRHVSSRGDVAGLTSHSSSARDTHSRFGTSGCAAAFVRDFPVAMPVAMMVPTGVAETIVPAAVTALTPSVSAVASTGAVGVDVSPWLDAARRFVMNTDFEVSFSRQSLAATAALCCGKGGSSDLLDLAGVMAAMKEQSGGKSTIQALSDKLLLHKMLDNLGVPQLPALFVVEGPEPPSSQEVEDFVTTHFSSETATDVVMKPTHLSNGTGVLVISRPPPGEVPSVTNYLSSHMAKMMDQRASAQESEALRSLRPGFLVQPRYQSAVGFETPLELRVLCLWGQARVAIWWWGRETNVPGTHPRRNSWLVRRPVTPGQLSVDDKWEVAHRHAGTNIGFDKALEIFLRHIPAIAATAEAVASAFGAPFLRSDFFVGSTHWGVRLNEVAYGCGCEYCSIASDGSGRVVDDSLAVAQIIQEGMAICERKQPPETFLSRLGANGNSYVELASSGSVAPLPPWARAPWPSEALNPDGDVMYEEVAVPKELCSTFRGDVGCSVGKGASVPCAVPNNDSLSGPLTQVLLDRRSHPKATAVICKGANGGDGAFDGVVSGLQNGDFAAALPRPLQLRQQRSATPAGAYGGGSGGKSIGSCGGICGCGGSRTLAFAHAEARSLPALLQQQGPQGQCSAVLAAPQRIYTPSRGKCAVAGSAALPQRKAPLSCASASGPANGLATPTCDVLATASPLVTLRSAISSPVVLSGKLQGNATSVGSSMVVAQSPVLLTPRQAHSSPFLRTRTPRPGNFSLGAVRSNGSHAVSARAVLCA